MRKSFTYEGKRYFIRCKDEADFIQKKADKIAEIKHDIKIIRANTTVNAWKQDWTETYRADVSDKWKRHIDTLLDRFADEYGGYPLKQIKQKNVQLYINQLSGSSQVTLNKNLQILKAFFETAKDNDLLSENPVKNIKLPKAPQPEARRSLTPYEREILLRVADYHEGGLYMKIMLYCGLRTMEVAALIGKDVDLKRKTITVNKTVKYDGSVGEPKTSHGFREVPIPDILLADFEEMDLDPFSPVVTTKTGRRYRPGSVERMWRSYKQCMNIEMGQKEDEPFYADRVAPDLVMYCLRHTYCTDLQDAGVPINIARELMGHSSIEITARIYTHHTEASLENARNMINACHACASPSSTIEK